MRTSIPNYSQLVAPLMQLLDVAAKTIDGSRKKIKLAKVTLSSVGWSDDHDACFAATKAALQAIVPLAHPTSDKVLCLFTDASDGFWGAVATQVPHDDMNLPVSDQRHEPLIS